MDNILDDNVTGSGLDISSVSRRHLLETAKWGKFMSIVGFVMIGLMILLSIGMATFLGASLSELGGMGGAMGGAGIGAMYLVIAVIYIFPILYLYRFATGMKDALDRNDQHAMEASLGNLKSCFKFIGIFTMVMVIIYVLIFVLAIVGGAAATMF